MIKRIIIIVLVLIAITGIAKRFTEPDYIKIIKIDSQRCYDDLQINENIICD